MGEEPSEDFTAITSFAGLASTAPEELRAEGRFPRSWAQGRAVFGGAVTGACVRAARALAPVDRALLSVDTAFLGPLSPETPTELVARVARSGKSVCTVEATLSQAGQPCARTLATFALPRPSKLSVTAPTRAIPPREGLPLPHLAGVTPTFLQHFELIWAVGAYPYMGASEAVLGGHCRHRTTADGEPALIALLDAWPAPILPLMKGPAAASTVRWSAHLVDAARFDPAQPCFFEARAVSARDGYATTLGQLYDGEGQLIAWMEQLVAYFEA